MTRDLFNRYLWLVDIIYRSGKITFEDISRKWINSELSGGKPFSLRTFHNHRRAIEELFDIDIICNKSAGNYYYIENDDSIKNNALRHWILDTFSVNYLLKDNNKLQDRILLENIPSGRVFLSSAIESMKENRICQIVYQNFVQDKATTLKVEPYCLKLFKKRWYLLALNIERKQLRIYSLDRIKDFIITEDRFEYPSSFHPQDYFSVHYGIIVNEAIKSEHIQIKAYGIKKDYIRSLPLHHSQEELLSEDTFSIFQYYIRPTHDFYQELLSHGDEIEVISPDWFRKKFSSIIEKMNKAYCYSEEDLS
ncbi:YafY family protein [Bacteroides sp. 51]|uniref:helix-turn-helix transcriptional regulator n=1 Tax=Bacteroides sp. 51 TaxID=2302938 RepID=UPI0013D70A0A|nr:WYL domain-containing protein [Bacteroides sp. 51]NDV82470.1 WYL domain-containing protein [Bacteroides sp. 51]